MSGGAIGYGQSANSTPLRATLVKQGTTSITFNMSMNTIGAWRPGFATIRVSGTQNGLQEYWAAWYIIRLTGYFGSGLGTSVLSSGGDTGSVTLSTSSDQNSPQAFSVTLTDNGGTTNNMIADIDIAYNEGIISLT
jgi:Flp pilus assembly protein TadG